MNAGREVLRKMAVAVYVLSACSGMAPSLFAQTEVNSRPATRPQKPSVKANPLHSSLPAEKAVAKLGQMPMYFEENRGQSDSPVKFLSRGRGYTLFLTEDEAVLALKKKPSAVSSQSSASKQKSANEPAVLRMALAGASRTARISGEEQLPGKIFYATGGQTGPLSGNATYQRVKYAEVYPGIELEYYGNETRLEFDFVVAPHADPNQIRLSFSGAEKIKLTKYGELSLRVSGEEVRLKKPLIYQERNGQRTEIAGGYVLTGKGKREAVFQLAPYDSSLPLVIDPQIDFATYLGGMGLDSITDVRVTPTGEVYVLGQTEPSTGFPTTQTIPPPGLYPSDCFVSKLSADGSTLRYSVIFPGTAGNSMAVDLFGKVHLSLFDWGIGSFLRTLAQDSTGTLALTPLQGAFDFYTSAQNMQVDSQGNVYMVIYYYPIGATNVEYGLFKVDASGLLVGTKTLLVVGTLPGGGYPPAEQITGLAVDDAGHAFVIGGIQTAGRITPTANAFQAVQPSSCGPSIYSWCDGIVMEIDTNTPNSFSIAYASYLGGSGSDYLGDIAVGHDGALYITGQTQSIDFPTTPGPFSGPIACQGCLSGFVTKLDLTKSGSQQLALGVVSSSLSLGGYSIAVLPGGLPAILSAQSGLFTGVNPLYTNVPFGAPSLVVFSNDGTSLVFASHLQPDMTYYNTWMTRMASNGSGKLYVAGQTDDPRLGSPGAYQENLAGGNDGLVRSISGIATNSPPIVDLGPPITVSQPLFTLDCGNTLFCDISDPDGDPLVSYRWIGPNGFTATSPSGPPVASVQLHAGSNQISLIVTDNQGAVGSGTLTVDVVDTDPPIVLPPPDLQTHSTEPGGARGSASSLLHNFLFAGATASDLLDPNPVALPPQADFGAGPVDVDDQTLFPLGSTLVTFRFQDSSGHVGIAVASVTIATNQSPSVFLGNSFFGSTATATSPAGANATIYAYAIDPENDPLTFAWSGSIAGLTLSQAGPNNEQMSGVLPIGVHDISVTVTDGHGGSATASITITVLGINTTGPQTVGLLDDNWQQANFSSYWRGNPLGGHLITLTFSNVHTPGLSYFSSRSDLVPPPPAGMQAGSPPYYYDIGTTAGYSGNIDVCVAIRGMSFANPGAIQLYQLQGGSWTALTSSLTPGSQICASTPSLSLGTFAIFYPEVPATAISTIAGSGIRVGSIDGPGGDPRDDDVASGPGTSVPLSYPMIGTFDRTRNYLYISDGSQHVRRLNLSTGILSIVVGNGSVPWWIDGQGGDPQDDVPEGVAPLSTPAAPYGGALDAIGNLYYSDLGSCQVRKVDFTANTVNTVAGNGTCGFSGDGGPALQASIGVMGSALAVDSSGNLFIADYDNHRIRRVDALTGVITTVAGNGTQPFPTPGVATLSEMPSPSAIAFDAQGYLLVLLRSLCVVRISPGADSQIKGDTDEILSIVAGDPLTRGAGIGWGLLPFAGDGGTATQATLGADYMVVARDGALILTDTGGNRVRRVSPGADGIVTGAPDEMITTVAGYQYSFVGTGIFNGDTYSTMATLAFPVSAVEDAQGGIIVMDSNNNRIRRFGLSPFLASGPGNWPPLANSQPISTSFNTPVLIVLTGSDLDNDPLTFIVLSQPFGGQLSGSAPNLTYTPNPGFQGTATFTFKVNDGKVDSNLATVTITVQPPASPDLSVDVTAFPDPVNTGSNLVLSVTVVNGGPGDATGVVFDYLLPSSVNFVSASPSQGTCTTPAVGSSGTVSCDLGTMPDSTTPIVSMASVTIVVTPTVAGPLASVFTLSGNEPDPNRVNNTATVNVTVAQGPAIINITEQIVVTDSPALLPSAMIGVNENITVTDGPVVLPSAMIGVNENILVTDVSTPLPSAMIGVNENIVVTDAPVVIPQDNTPPVVTPPPSMIVAATEAGGARGNVSLALHGFLAGATATDDSGAAPTQLPPEASGQPADDLTLFPVGMTQVTFRFRDAAGNIGTATADVYVNPPIGGHVGSGRVPINPTNANNLPMPIELTFTGVTQPGLATATLVNLPPPAPSGFQFGRNVFDISTTALYTPPIEVCFVGSGFNVSHRLFHYENGNWVDVTTLATSTRVCGVVNSLSPFGVVEPLNQPPVLILPGNLAAEASSAAGAAVAYTATATDPEQGSLAPTCAPASGSVFPLGTTTVNCSVTDAVGAQATGSFTITVVDTTPPVLSLPANINAIATSASGAAVNYSATASDLVSGAIVPSCLPAPGATFPIGITTVNCSATDTAGNSASGSFSVNVNLGTPRISGAIAAKGRDSAGNFYVDLRLTNSGNGNAQSIRLRGLTFRTLAGTGLVSYNASLSGALPLSAGNLAVGASMTLRLYLTVPATVTRFSITENGTLQNVAGTNSSFSIAQSVIP